MCTAVPLNKSPIQLINNVIGRNGQQFLLSHLFQSKIDHSMETDQTNLEDETSQQDEDVVGSESLAEEEHGSAANFNGEFLSQYSTMLETFPPIWRDEVCVLFCMVNTIHSLLSEEIESTSAENSDGLDINEFGEQASNHLRGLLADQGSEIVLTSGQVLYPSDSEQQRNFLHRANYIPSKIAADVSELRQFQNRARRRRQIARLMMLPAFAVRPGMTAVERGIKESELMTFSELDSESLYRGDQLRIFNEMIVEQTKLLPNFTGALNTNLGLDHESIVNRKFFRELSALDFSSLLSSETSYFDPLVLARYYEMSDQILLALHWLPPARRNERKTWRYEGSADSNIPPSLKDFQLESVTLTPAGRTLVKVSCFIIRQQSRNLSTKSPKGRSSRRGQPTTDAPLSRSTPWLSAVFDDSYLGIRMNKPTGSVITASGDDLGCSMFFLTPENTKISFYRGPSPLPVTKPDKQGTVCVTIRLPSELSVTVCSNGDIRYDSEPQVLSSDQLLCQVPAYGYPLFLEKRRLIGPNMTILRTFDADCFHPFTQECLYLDGSRELWVERSKVKSCLKKAKKHQKWAALLEFKLLETLPPNATMIRLSPDGSVFYGGADMTNQQSTQYPCILHHQVDATMNVQIDSFEDGRIIIHRANGIQEVSFPDGTHMIYDSESKTALLSRNHVRCGQMKAADNPYFANGWPSIEMDLDVDSTSRNHAKGREVPINKGGQRVRTRVCIPDGTAVLIKYDTRVTATTNGSLRVVTRDRHSFEAFDDATVKFVPNTGWTEESEKIFNTDCAFDLAPSSTPAPEPSLTMTGALMESTSKSLLHPSLSAMTSTTKTKSARKLELNNTVI